MKFDILLQSLRPSYRSHATKWVRGVEADSLTEACEIAKAKYPNLGITQTEVSMAWPQWPQKEIKYAT